MKHLRNIGDRDLSRRTLLSDEPQLPRHAGRRDGGVIAGPAGLYGVQCRCSCSLIVKEELNIFSLGLSPSLEAEEKMWRGVGRGLESEMRSRDDLRRRAR